MLGFVVLLLLDYSSNVCNPIFIVHQKLPIKGFKHDFFSIIVLFKLNTRSNTLKSYEQM